MSKALKGIFVFLSVVLICALCFACVQITSEKPPVNNADGSVAASAADSSTEVSVAESSEVISAEESSAEVSAEESSEEVSAEESSEEESSLPPVGETEPVTVPPTSVAASEYDSYFNGSVFVGHSVMVHFKNYVNSWRTTVSGDMLGDAIFCCTSSFSFYNNLNQTPATADNVLPRYQGKAYNIEDLPAVTGVETVYLGLMGLNDLGMVGKADTCAKLVAEEAIDCIEKLKAASPEVEVVVLASTYLTRDKSFRNLNNRNMSLLNSYVLEYCNENGIDFIDVATPLTDGGRYLASVYCSDDYCHLRENAYYVWMDVLRDYARQKLDGTWKNPQSVPLFGE